jgi:hypothetical protein
VGRLGRAVRTTRESRPTPQYDSGQALVHAVGSPHPHPVAVEQAGGFHRRLPASSTVYSLHFLRAADSPEIQGFPRLSNLLAPNWLPTLGPGDAWVAMPETQRQQIEQALRRWPASLRYATERSGGGHQAQGHGRGPRGWLHTHAAAALCLGSSAGLQAMNGLPLSHIPRLGAVGEPVKLFSRKRIGGPRWRKRHGATSRCLAGRPLSGILNPGSARRPLDEPGRARAADWMEGDD